MFDEVFDGRINRSDLDPVDPCLVELLQAGRHGGRGSDKGPLPVRLFGGEDLSDCWIGLLMSGIVGRRDRQDLVDAQLLGSSSPFVVVELPEAGNPIAVFVNAHL